MNRTTPGALAAAGLLLTCSLALTGCGTHADAPDPTGQPGTHGHVIQEPDGFRNVTFSCFGVDGVYVTSASASDTLPSGIAVVANDPNCKD